MDALAETFLGVHPRFEMVGVGLGKPNPIVVYGDVLASDVQAFQQAVADLVEFAGSDRYGILLLDEVPSDHDSILLVAQ